MSLTTARVIIDSARIRHWAFSDLQVGDGAALLFLNSRLRTHLALHGAKIEGLVGSSMSYSATLAPPTLLVTNTGSILVTNLGVGIQTVSGQTAGIGIPQVALPYQDGWPVHLDANNVPYVDFSEAPIAGDPFGINGGTPGFPLPVDMIRLINVSLVYANPCGVQIPCDVIPESQRFTSQPGRNPLAFLSGNRLVPVRVYNTAGLNAGDRWSSVLSIQISYVGVQQLTTLDDVLNLPSVLAEALIADTANYMAMLSKLVPVAEKGGFASEAAKAGAMIATAALDLVNEPQQNSVHYMGR